MSELFVVATSGEKVSEVVEFPDSFDEMLQLVHEYQSGPWPVHANSNASTLAAIEHFATEWFPRPLQSFGRALVTSFLPAQVRRVHDISPPSPPLRVAARIFMAAGLGLATYCLPDPHESVLESRRRRAADGLARDSFVERAVRRVVVNDTTPRAEP